MSKKVISLFCQSVILVIIFLNLKSLSIMTIQGITTDTLLEWLANATKTYYGCLGHNKADMNRLRVKSYKAELQARAIKIPADDELLKTGIFNGDGSY